MMDYSAILIHAQYWTLSAIKQKHLQLLKIYHTSTAKFHATYFLPVKLRIWISWVTIQWETCFDLLCMSSAAPPQRSHKALQKNLAPISLHWRKSDRLKPLPFKVSHFSPTLSEI